MRPAHRLRQVVNVVNLSTLAGLLLARIGGARVRRSRNGLMVGHGYALPVPPAPAFTLGNVVLLRGQPPPGRDPIGSVPVPLLAHEERHATQYALAGGVLMPVLYLAAAGWSWLRTGDFASRNAFERRAGLADGGYRERPARAQALLVDPAGPDPLPRFGVPGDRDGRACHGSPAGPLPGPLVPGSTR